MTTDNTALTLEEVREQFSRDRFATANGAVIEAVEEGYAKCSMILNETHRNAMGAVMGGAIFTLADFAFAVASNCFLGGAKGSKLIAEAVKIKEGRKTCYYEVTVCDELGNQIAHMTSNGYCLDKA